MARTVPRTTDALRRPPIDRTFQQYQALRAEVATLDARIKTLKGTLMSEVEANGYQDDKGSYYLDLAQPIEIGGKTYSRMKRERRGGSVTVDEDYALALATEKNVYDRVVKMVPTLDQEEFWVLNQEGIITDEELAGVFRRGDDTWAFVAVTD